MSVVEDNNDSPCEIPLQNNNPKCNSSPAVTIQAEQPMAAVQDNNKDNISKSTIDRGLLPKYVTPKPLIVNPVLLEVNVVLEHPLLCM